MGINVFGIIQQNMCGNKSIFLFMFIFKKKTFQMIYFVDFRVPCKPSTLSGINNVFAVDAEHEHCSVLHRNKDKSDAVCFNET